MRQKLHTYIQTFNRQDDEIYQNLIPNREAEDFLYEQVPLLDCPDKTLEATYYFRWWTFRKHIRETEYGHVITEFLPDVPWSGAGNAINCPVGFHLREGRWLKDPAHWLKEYIRFWLDGIGNIHHYSCWLAHGVLEYCAAKNEYAFAIECLPKLIAFFEQRERVHRRTGDIYWSSDFFDGMEYSVSGPGLRPTINSYAWADATAIAKIAKIAGDGATWESFTQKADQIKARTEALLWDGTFYKTVPLDEKLDNPYSIRPEVDGAHDAKELAGYIPWYFGMPEDGKEAAFAELLKKDGFQARVGLTTVERRHPRFMEEHEHECLWNGPVWPFATSQVLVAVANVLRGAPQKVLTKEDYYRMLWQYAASQRMTKEDGTEVFWIDEDQHPDTGRWISRDILRDWNWREDKGGYERGKDYNHSLFCDLILSGLLGISVNDGTITANPMIPDDWDYFRVENLWLNGDRYRVTFDRDGTHYAAPVGLTVETY